jgi:hypothetical protein
LLIEPMQTPQTEERRPERFAAYIAARRFDPPRPLLIRAAGLAEPKDHALDAGAGALVTGQSCDPFVHEALLPAPDHRFVLADRARVMALVPWPSAVSKTTRARQTCFCGLLRSRTIASNRTRSAGVTAVEIPLRIAQARTKRPRAKQKMGVFC